MDQIVYILLYYHDIVILFDYSQAFLAKSSAIFLTKF